MSLGAQKLGNFLPGGVKVGEILEKMGRKGGSDLNGWVLWGARNFNPAKSVLMLP